jgi:hypothetical protein
VNKIHNIQLHLQDIVKSLSFITSAKQKHQQYALYSLQNSCNDFVNSAIDADPNQLELQTKKSNISSVLKLGKYIVIV